MVPPSARIWIRGLFMIQPQRTALVRLLTGTVHLTIGAEHSQELGLHQLRQIDNLWQSCL
jgi:hypothetical protein